MRSPLCNADLRSLVAGVGIAAAAGLLLGAAMQPNLRGPAEVEGPQMLAGVSGVRTYDYGGAGFTAYHGQIPDYVVGTDWLKAPEWADEPPQPDLAYQEDQSYVFDEGDPAPAPAEIAQWEEPAEPTRFPSTDGGLAYGVEPPQTSPPEPGADADLAEMAAATPS